MGPDDPRIQALWPRVYTLAHRMLGNAADAEDAAQETFVRALDRFETYRGEAGWEHWVLRIGTRVSLDALEGRRRRRSAGELDLDAFPAPEPVAPVEPVRDRLQPCLDDLPPQQRAAFVLREVQGLAFETVSELMDCSPATCRVHLMKARLALRESWLRRYGERP